MGARDNLAQGRSTFLVELGETSNILKKYVSPIIITFFVFTLPYQAALLFA
jgi:hypothetical protein